MGCFIVQPLETTSREGFAACFDSGRCSFVWVSGWPERTFEITIPDIPGITEVSFEAEHYFTTYGLPFDVNCDLVIKKNGVQIGRGTARQALPVSAGDVVTVELKLAGSCSETGGKTGSYSIQTAYQNMRFITALDIPAQSREMYALEVNCMARILQVPELTVGSEITLSGMQAIGTAIGNMTSEWNGGTAATPVTFDTTEPKYADYQACAANMEGKYIVWT